MRPIFGSRGEHNPSPSELVNNINEPPQESVSNWSLLKQKHTGWPCVKGGIDRLSSLGAGVEQDGLLFNNFPLIPGVVQFRCYKLILVRFEFLV